MTVPAHIPDNEADRLAYLRELVLLDTEPEALFDSITAMASDICGAPIALLCLIDSERQWFKANVGLTGIQQTPRNVAFCAHTILDDGTLVVPDATLDARFAANPLVTSSPDIRFYAGAPLIVEAGLRVGTLCVIDRKPRTLDANQTRMLQSLAKIASQALAARRQMMVRAGSLRTQFEAALAARERQYRTIVEDQSELVSLSRRDGRLVFVNEAYARHFGRTPAQLIGESLFDLIEEADRDAVRHLIDRVFMQGERQTSENRSMRADGPERWVSWTNAVQVDADGQPLLHSVGRDITPERLAQRELIHQTATLRSVAEAVPALVSVVGADLRYRLVNGAFERWVGRSRDGIIGRTMVEVMGDEEAERSRPWFERALAGESISFEKEFPERIDARHMAISFVPLRLDARTIDGFIAIAQDITHHKSEERRLLALALRDPLTDQLNRAGFTRFLEDRVNEGLADSLAVLYIDLDHFKAVNDQHGHAVGDQLLQVFAARLRRVVRPTDAVARLGGDEFAIALVGVSAIDQAVAVADKVLGAAATPIGIEDLTLNVSASVGVAFGIHPAAGWEDLVARADAHLYRAKHAGRGQQSGGLG